MDRLTWEYKDGGMFVDGTTVKKFECDDVEIYTGNAILKLSRYEDTGLEPGEIKKVVILAKAYIMEALKENEKSIAILKSIGGDTHQIEAASTGLKNLLIKLDGQQEGEL